MEHFEHIALTTTTNSLDIWYRYVDDTVIKTDMANIDNFTQHNNNINPHIRFTREQVKEGKLPLLHILVHVNKNDTSRTTVYRKTKHTDQYLQ